MSCDPPECDLKFICWTFPLESCWGQTQRHDTTCIHMWFLQRARWILPRLRMTVWKIMKDWDEAHHPFRFSFDCWCVNPRPMMSWLISKISSPKSSVYFCYGVQNSTVRHVQTNRVCHQEALENQFTSSFWCPLWERTSTDAIFLWDMLLSSRWSKSYTTTLVGSKVWSDTFCLWWVLEAELENNNLETIPSWNTPWLPLTLLLHSPELRSKKHHWWDLQGWCREDASNENLKA